MIKSILGIGSVVKWENKFFKVERLYDDSRFNQLAQLSQKGELIADVDTKAIKWNGKQFVVEVDKL